MSGDKYFMQNQLEKESLVLSTTPIIRQAPGSNTAMRKYQQLTLAIVSVVSLVAFIFYKHEYERLRYTLEYMDTFGEPPSIDLNAGQQCQFLAQMRAATPPAEWTTVTQDVAVYSSFWEDNGGITESKLRTIALIETTGEPPSELEVKLWYESGHSVLASCEMEKAEQRNHVDGDSNVFHIVFLLCAPDSSKEKNMRTKVPHLVQFSNGKGDWTDFKSVHESDSYKSVVDKSAVCVLPTTNPENPSNLVEFISHFQILGFQKFVFYGNGLTSVTRNLLNRFMDEIGIMVEEKSFNYVPSLQGLRKNSSVKKDNSVLEYIIRHVIELDCQYRHRDTFENIVVVQANEFIIPNAGQTLKDIVSRLSVVSDPSKAVTEFHLSTQHVCIDKAHPTVGSPSPLLLGQQTLTNGPVTESGVAILRPHLTTSVISGVGLAQSTQQHVSPASALVYRYSVCASQERHSDTLHLPSKAKFVSLIEHSLLYRKWKVYEISQ